MSRKGRKSAAQTSAPKKDRIYLSKTNRQGSAASKESAKSIVFSESIIETLKEKADNFNKTHPAKKVTLNTLKAVFRRGAGAYSKSHRPTISGGKPNSRTAWAYARVNKFLLKKGGTKVKAAYVQDDDLMEFGGETNTSNMNEIKVVTYFIYKSSPNEDELVATTDDKDEALKEYTNINLNDFEISQRDKSGLSKRLDTLTKTYKFVGQLDDGEELLDYMDESYYDDEDYWKLVDEEFEELDNKTISRVNEKADNLLDVIKSHFGAIGGYRVIPIGDENLTLRIKDHTGHIKNRGESKYFLSVVISDQNPTLRFKERGVSFKPSQELYFTSDDTPETIISVINDHINEYMSEEGVSYKDGGSIGQNISCVRCGWKWNTKDSQDFDKYVCHNCGFDNRTYYDSDPVGKYHLGGDMSKHLAPNGKPSNLTHEQWHLVRTPQFKAWFGDWENDPNNASKVIDENGEPLVVYRGNTIKDKTTNIFKYNVNRFSDNRKTNRFGFYFTESKEVAKKYASQVEGERYYDSKTKTYKEISKDDLIIKEYFLNIKNLLDITPTNSNYPSFNEFIDTTNILFENSTSELIRKAENREIPEYSYLYDKYKGTKDIDFNTLNELLINDLKNKLASQIEQEKRLYKYEISAYQLAKLISKKDGERLINEEYEDYTNFYKLKNKNDIYNWFINRKLGDEIVPDIDLFFKKLIIDNQYDGGVFNEAMSNNQKQDLVYFCFESNQIKLADGSNTTFDSRNPDIRFQQGGLIAPNGKKSNLTPIQYKLVRTPQFKAWFGDWENDPANASKMVDENGEPLVVHHGTKYDFNTFRGYKLIWTTPEIGYIDKMKGMLESNRVIDLFANSRKILDLTQYGYKYYDQKTAYNIFLGYGIKLSGILTQKFGSIFYSYLQNHTQELKDQMMESGYDGIKVKVHRNYDFSFGFLQPNQIKLADGTNNTFDMKNPDIRYRDGGLIAPNGKPSNLTPEQYKLVRTPEFKSFFGDWENDPANASKVVDENGEPMVVYHGTTYDFTIFKLEKPKVAAYGQGFYFTNDKGFASNYARGENGKILSIFLNIRKVFEINNDELPSGYEKYSDMEYNKGKSRDFTSRLLQEGYNGVYAKNRYNENELVVFNPNQIKLADGSNTTFDGNNPDIRYDEGGETDFGKVLSSSSRFRPNETIYFNPPLVGVNGVKLISYTWAYEWTMQPNWEGEMVGKRVSNWEQAEKSAETGRDIVHKYTVEFKDGKISTVSSDSVPIVLGYLEKKQSKILPNLITASKTLAKQRLELSIMNAKRKEYDDAIEEIKRRGIPPLIIKKDEDGRTRYTIGEGSCIAFIEKSTPAEIKYQQDERTECALRSYLSIEVKKMGIDEYAAKRTTYDLEKRIERQEKKIKEILSKDPNSMEDGGETDFNQNDISYYQKIKAEMGMEVFKPSKSIEQIAKEKGVSLEYAKKQLELGINIESEHSNLPYVQETIALQHLDEMIDYYKVLQEVESAHSEKEHGGKIDKQGLIQQVEDNQQEYKYGGQADDCGCNGQKNESGGYLLSKKDGKQYAHNNADNGGLLIGRRHSEGGIDGKIESSGQDVEVEAGELVVSSKAINSTQMNDFNGKKMTNKEVLSMLNQQGGGVAFADGGEVGEPIEYKGGEVILTRGAVSNPHKYNFNGKSMTTKEIASQINYQATGKSFDQGGDIPINNTIIEGSSHIDTLIESYKFLRLPPLLKILLLHNKMVQLDLPHQTMIGGCTINGNVYGAYHYIKTEDGKIIDFNMIDIKNDDTLTYFGEYKKLDYLSNESTRELLEAAILNDINLIEQYCIQYGK